MEIFLYLLGIVAGIIGLVWSADKFVLGASTTARNMGVSLMVIGMTVVAFGTSAPEIFTSATAALKGAPELAIGNVVGSNIANIGLVLSITLLISPVMVPESVIKDELPALLIVTVAAFIVFFDHKLDWMDGVLLLLILAGFTWRLLTRKDKVDTEEFSSLGGDASEHIADISTAKSVSLMIFGLVMILISANLLVYGASGIARTLGVSELVIGLTIVAVGTSLPELAASVASAIKGHHDLALGNVIGSNILNLLLVLPVPAFLSPMTIDAEVLWRDTLSMLLITLVLAAAIWLKKRKHRVLGKPFGAVLLVLYLSYTVFLLISN